MKESVAMIAAGVRDSAATIAPPDDLQDKAAGVALTVP